jgi:hypothetical protein
MVKRYAQKEGIDYEKNFTPLAKWATIHALLALATHNKWKICHINVKTTFLNKDLKENVYMSQTNGLVMKSQEHEVCKLLKSLYSLKQAPRTWYEKVIEHLLKINFKHFNLNDATLFVWKVYKTIVYLGCM